MNKTSRLQEYRDQIGKRIKEIRIRHDETIEQLAEAIHLSAAQLGKIERGVNLATTDTIFYTALHYNVPTDYFFQDIPGAPEVSLKYLKDNESKKLSGWKSRLEAKIAEDVDDFKLTDADIREMNKGPKK